MVRDSYAPRDFQYFNLISLILIDEIGADVSNHVGHFMAKADLGVRVGGGDQSLLQGMVDKKWLGRKAGKGFYVYPAKPKKGEKKQVNQELVETLRKIREERGLGAPAQVSKEDIQYRMVSRFINEAAFSLQDEIIRSPTDGKSLLRRVVITQNTY